VEVVETTSKAVGVMTPMKFKEFLYENERALIEAASKDIDPKHVISMALVAASGESKIRTCTPTSIIRCLVQASRLGLDVSGQLGEAYLIPYGRELVLMIGYRGLIQLARRSGKVSRIEARIVYANDAEFRVTYGDDPRVHHSPLFTADRGAMDAFYAIAWLTDGSKQFEVMSTAEVDYIRSKSKSGGSGPWKDYYDEMGRKTVVRRLMKYLPLSYETQMAINEVVELEDQAWGLETSGALREPSTGDINFNPKAKPVEQEPESPLDASVKPAERGDEPDQEEPTPKVTAKATKPKQEAAAATREVDTEEDPDRKQEEAPSLLDEY